MGFSLYFLASVPEGEKTPEPGSVEAHRYLWSYPGTTLEPEPQYSPVTTIYIYIYIYIILYILYNIIYIYNIRLYNI